METFARMRGGFGGLVVLSLLVGADSFAARPTPARQAFGKRKPMGSQVVEGRDCCAHASQVEKTLLSKLEEALAGTSKGILGNKTVQNKCSLHREFYITWWGGADGWTWADDNDTDLLPKVKAAVAGVYSPARAENCKIVKANPEGVFTGDKPVVLCSYDRVCQRPTGAVAPRPLPNVTGRPDTAAGANCTRVLGASQKKLAELNEAFAGEAKGILGAQAKPVGGSVEVSFHATWWAGADGWTYDSSEADTKTDLLPKIQAKASQFFPNIKCSAVKANPEGVFMGPQSVVYCELKIACSK